MPDGSSQRDLLSCNIIFLDCRAGEALLKVGTAGCSRDSTMHCSHRI